MQRGFCMGECDGFGPLSANQVSGYAGMWPLMDDFVPNRCKQCVIFIRSGVLGRKRRGGEESV